MNSWDVKPCVLKGRLIRLEPLQASHVSALTEIGLEPELWRLQPRPVTSQSEMAAYVDAALNEQRQGLGLPFVIIRCDTETIIGTTRYMDISPEHRRLEIGATWIAKAHQRTGANVEAKLLLLAHAFDVLGVHKVVFKTEATNTQSRQALLHLGAKEEGTLRDHLLADDGRRRAMVFFSILEAEWPAVRRWNEERLLHSSGQTLVESDSPQITAGEIHVRTLGAGDFRAIVSRVDDWWGRSVRSQLPRLFFEHFNDTSFVVEQQGQIIGFLIGFLSSSQPEVAYIHFAGVDPQHWGRGIARELYGRFADLAVANGRTQVRAITSPQNRRSILFHRQLGFQFEPTRSAHEAFVHENYGPDGEPRVVMVKDIS